MLLTFKKAYISSDGAIAAQFNGITATHDVWEPNVRIEDDKIKLVMIQMLVNVREPMKRWKKQSYKVLRIDQWIVKNIKSKERKFVQPMYYSLQMTSGSYSNNKVLHRDCNF